ncbi:site-specific integrase [Methylobacterium sp. CM6257]
MRAYTSDARVFQNWCARYGFRSLPASPEAVAGFIVHEAGEGRAASTLGRRMAAIRHAHTLAVSVGVEYSLIVGTENSLVGALA